MPEADKKPAGSSNIVKSFDYALRGITYAIKTQRNMRIHFITAILVMIMSALIFAISLVFIAELINTAAEYMVDLITEEHHPIAKVIKDMMAGAVLFSAICAAVIAYLVFIRQEVLDVFEQTVVINKISSFPPYIAAIIVFLVLVISIFIKAVRQEHPSIAGGMPSIHTAVAFSLTTITYFLSRSEYVLCITLILAIMIGHARISAGIHKFWEVVAGAVLGTATTVLIFQLVV